MNTSEQLKAETIKKAWVAEIGEEAYDNISSLIRKDDGFAHGRAFTQFQHNGSPLQSVIFNGYLHYRPISLKYLENNNGWIRIEPDGSNLQKELRSVDCESGLLTKNGFERTENHFMNLLTLFRSGLITHYKPIIKSKPPIY